MKKPFSLRQHLIACSQALQADPEKLQVYLDSGVINSTLPAHLSFSYQYHLNIIVTDTNEHPDIYVVPLLAWLKVNQLDVTKDGVKFEADILDNDRIDLSLTVPLDERVVVSLNEDNNYTVDHQDEPQAEYNQDVPTFKQLYGNDVLIPPVDNG